MWPSAIGSRPQDNVAISHRYPWTGFRIGVIGTINIGAHRTR